MLFKRIFISLSLLFLCALSVSAHKPSNSYINLDFNQSKYEIKLALRDLDYALDLDSNADNKITWAELKAKRVEIFDYLTSRLNLLSKAKALNIVSAEYGLAVEELNDGVYAVISGLDLASGLDYQASSLAYNLFFDFDPQHKALVNIFTESASQTLIFSHENSKQKIFESKGFLANFIEFVKEGIWHIWIGLDHILFILALLLPSVFIFERNKIKPVKDFQTAFWKIFKIVTAFTIAHSITLSLAALGIVELNSRLVESVIAASVALAALNNIFPIVREKTWSIAFIFGLIHGFGFASVLADLDLTKGDLVTSLFGFNVGVELGQMAIVLAFIPLAFWMRWTWLYEKVVLKFGSFIIFLIAVLWSLERSLGLEILVF